DPQLDQRAVGALGGEQAAAVLAGGRVPGGDRGGVAGADQLGGGVEAAGDGGDRVGDRLAVGGEDVGPDPRVGAGDAGRVAEARADLGDPLAARQVGGGLGDERVGDRVRHPAHRRPQPVVAGGVE